MRKSRFRGRVTAAPAPSPFKNTGGEKVRKLRQYFDYDILNEIEGDELEYHVDNMPMAMPQQKIGKRRGQTFRANTEYKHKQEEKEEFNRLLRELEEYLNSDQLIVMKRIISSKYILAKHFGLDFNNQLHELRLSFYEEIRVLKSASYKAILLQKLERL